MVLVNRWLKVVNLRLIFGIIIVKNVTYKYENYILMNYNPSPSLRRFFCCC